MTRRLKNVLGVTVLGLLSGLDPSTLFGEQPVSVGLNANFDHQLAASAHVGWSRLNILWSEVNPQAGVWDFGFTDAKVNTAVSNGQQVLAILANPPQWAGGGPNQNIPPLTTSGWSEFVRRCAQRYVGKVQAYEIWNEPDLKSTSQIGIGWGRNIEEPPLYIDFVHAAAVEIRAYAPGTLVVGPALLSRNTADGADNRKRRIFQQIQAASYPDGSGPSFIDVSSFHNNAGNTESSALMSAILPSENLAYLNNYCPGLRQKPVWVTEFGWKSNSVGLSGQREKICNIARCYTGRLNTTFNSWNLQRAFIYSQFNSGDSRSVFTSTSTGAGKPAVTQYLRYLAFPAVQNPANSDDAPSCSSPPPPLANLVSTENLDAIGALLSAGLRDPRPAIPLELSLEHESVSEDGSSIELRFGGHSEGDYLNILISPLSAGAGESFLNSVAARWTKGNSQLEVSGLLGGEPMGKNVLTRVAAALDDSFEHTCRVENFDATLTNVAELGLNAPIAPPGFRLAERTLTISKQTSTCQGIERGAQYDFLWQFADDLGARVKAGIYRYGATTDGSEADESAIRWQGPRGARYWVAGETNSSGASLRDAIDAIAVSMDPDFHR